MKRKASLAIINPTSAMGKTARRTPAIIEGLAKSLGSGFNAHSTSGPGEAERMARTAVHDGIDLIIAVGGDGTIQEVVNGMLSARELVTAPCGLGIISSGTGNGFAQSLGLPRDLEGQLANVRGSHERAVDVALLEVRSGEGQTQCRFATNEIQIGIGGEVVRRVRGRLKMLGGRMAFGVGTVASSLCFPNRLLRVATDTLRFEEECTGITISNGEFTGGGMNLTPGAMVDDGTLDVLVMRSMSSIARLWSFPKIYSAQHLRSPHFSLVRSREVSIASDEAVPVSADGELLGNTPCTVRVVPGCLRIRMQ